MFLWSSRAHLVYLTPGSGIILCFLFGISIEGHLECLSTCSADDTVDKELSIIVFAPFTPSNLEQNHHGPSAVFLPIGKLADISTCSREARSFQGEEQKRCKYKKRGLNLPTPRWLAWVSSWGFVLRMSCLHLGPCSSAGARVGKRVTL